jgi:hypothetical protein
LVIGEISMTAATTTAPAEDIERASSGNVPQTSDSLERVVGAVERHAVAVLVGLLLLSGALLMYLGHGLTFYYDEWEWILHDYGGGIHWMLLAHVGNISFFPAALYKVMFHLVGLGHYAVFRLNVVVLHLICGSLIYVMAARRIPRLPALLAATLILFLGAAWEDLLWAFQVGYLLSVAGGLAALVLIEYNRRLTDVLAMLCLIVAAGSSSLGVPIMAGVIVELSSQRRRLWIVLVPAALYVLWYLTHGVSQVTEESVAHAPRYAVELAAAAMGGLTGHGLDWGWPFVIASLAIVVYRLARRCPVSARLAGLLAAAIALWVVTALARSTISPPQSSRYIYLGAVLIVLIGVELLQGVTIPPRVSVLATLVVVLCVVSGLTLLRSGAVGLRTTSKIVTAELGAMEIAASYAPPGYRPDAVRAPPVYAGLYLHTVRSIGSSPADTPTEIEDAAPFARAAADKVLMALESPRLLSFPAAGLLAPVHAPSLVSLSRATQLRRSGCVQLAPLADSSMNVTLKLPASGLIIHSEGVSGVGLAVRRFGESFNPLPRASVPSRSAVLLSALADRAPQVPWQVRLDSRSRVLLCVAASLSAHSS